MDKYYLDLDYGSIAIVPTNKMNASVNCRMLALNEGFSIKRAEISDL